MTGQHALDILKNIVETSITNDVLRRVVLNLLANPKFVTAAGGATRHHQYPGGLAVHTLEVVEKLEPASQVAIAAGCLHDFAKIWAYEPRYPDGVTLTYVKTEQERKVGHVVESWRLFMEQATVEGLCPSLMLEVGHAMLAHHGRREWGSPVEPRTPEAYALHAADMLCMLESDQNNEMKGKK